MELSRTESRSRTVFGPRSEEWEARALARASGLQRYLENMSGQTVRVSISFRPSDDRPPGITWHEGSSRDSDVTGEWRVVIFPDSLESEDTMRLAARMLFTMTAGLIESVTKRMTDERVKAIAKAIEAARTEWLGDVWFRSNLADATRADLLAKEVGYRAVLQESEYNKDMTAAINKILYDIPGEFTNPLIEDAMDRFGGRIKSASRSMNQADSLNIAVEIADYLRWLEKPPPPGGDQESDEDSESSGKSSSTGNSTENNSGDKLSPSTTGSGGDSDEVGGDSPKAPSFAEYKESQGPDLKRQQTNLKRNITRNKKKGDAAQEQVKKNQEARKKANVRGNGHMPSLTDDYAMSSEFRGTHNVEIIDWPGETIQLDDHTKLALSTFVGNRISPNKLYKRGAVSPMHAWKLTHKGDLNIFRRPPTVKGHVSVMVDISGSMGCWCDACSATEYGSVASLPSYLSWQVTALLGQLHPTAEIFTYCGTDRGRGLDCKVIPLPAGQRPSGCARADRLSGGTPTCAAMMYFREHLLSRPSSTTAIIITDGAPDYCVEAGVHHVDHIGRDIMSKGIKFGTVFIGHGQYLDLPAEVSVNISSLNDIANIQPMLEALDS